MPAVQSYFYTSLDAITTATASGVSVHVRDQETAAALCDVSFTRDELRRLLERCDVCASLEETREHAPLAPSPSK